MDRLLEKYISGELTEAEEADFNNKMIDDPTFYQEFKDTIVVLVLMKQLGTLEKIKSEKKTFPDLAEIISIKNSNEPRPISGFKAASYSEEDDDDEKDSIE